MRTPSEEEERGNSPKSNSSSSSSSSSSSCCNSNGVLQLQHQSNKAVDTTTFIQADTTSFKQLVQMHTGSSQSARQSSKPPTNTSRGVIPPRKQAGGHKLYERRNSFKKLKVSPMMSGLVENRGREMEMLSPSMLDFPSLVINSPVTPLTPDPFNRSPPPPPPPSTTSYAASKLGVVEQEAIVKDGFYLHPSPMTTPRNTEPRLLPLFPLTSPKVASSSG